MADARLSQLPVEILSAAPTVDLRLSQIAIEVLRSSSAAEVVADDVLVTQLVLEPAHQQDGEARVTHTAVEVGWQADGEARVTQFLIEIIRRPVPSTPGEEPLEASYGRTFDCVHGESLGAIELEAAVSTRDCLHASAVSVEPGVASVTTTFEKDAEY